MRPEVAPAGFQNNALRLLALAIDGILRVKINLRRISERLCTMAAVHDNVYTIQLKKFLIGHRI
jgi:hypothetical protein